MCILFIHGYVSEATLALLALMVLCPREWGSVPWSKVQWRSKHSLNEQELFLFLTAIRQSLEPTFSPAGNRDDVNSTSWPPRSTKFKNACKFSFWEFQLIKCSYKLVFRFTSISESRSRLPQELRRGSMAARLLGLGGSNPAGPWLSVSWDYCVLSGRGLCHRSIIGPEESYRMWCFWAETQQ